MSTDTIQPARSAFRTAADLALILSGSVFTGLLTIAMSPITPLIREHFEGTVLMAQFVMVVPAIGVVLAGPFMGMAVDRWGTRRVLLTCTALYALLGVSGIFIETLTVLVISRLLLGVMASGIYTSTFTLAGERYSGNTRAGILGFKGAVGAGAATAVAIGAGAMAKAWGWQTVFLLYLLAIPAFLLAMGIQNTPRPQSTSQSSSPTCIAPLLKMWPVFLLLTLVFSSTFTTHAQGPFLLREHGVTDTAVIGLVLSAGSAAYALASFSYIGLRWMMGGETTFRVGLALVGVGAIAAAFSDSATSTAVCFAMFGFGNGMTAPYLHNLVLDRAPVAIRGRASGLVSPTHYGGEFLNPYGFKVLGYFGGLTGAFVILGISLLAAASVLRPQRWRHVEGAPALQEDAEQQKATLPLRSAATETST